MSNGTGGKTFQPAVSSKTMTKNITDSETAMNNDNQMQTTHGNITAMKEFYCDDNQANISGKLF